MYMDAFFVNIIPFIGHFSRRIVGAPYALHIAPIGKTAAFVGNNPRVHIHFIGGNIHQAFAPLGSIEYNGNRVELGSKNRIERNLGI